MHRERAAIRLLVFCLLLVLACFLVHASFVLYFSPSVSLFIQRVALMSYGLFCTSGLLFSLFLGQFSLKYFAAYTFLAASFIIARWLTQFVGSVCVVNEDMYF